MTRDNVYDEPSTVIAEDGEVIVDGPDGVAISFTPGAAIATSDRLFQAGVTARGQKIAKLSPEESSETAGED